MLTSRVIYHIARKSLFLISVALFKHKKVSRVTGYICEEKFQIVISVTFHRQKKNRTINFNKKNSTVIITALSYIMDKIKNKFKMENPHKN